MSSMPRCVFMCVWECMLKMLKIVFRKLLILPLSSYLSFKTVGNSQAGSSNHDQANEGRFCLNVSTVMFV